MDIQRSTVLHGQILPHHVEHGHCHSNCSEWSSLSWWLYHLSARADGREKYLTRKNYLKPEPTIDNIYTIFSFLSSFCSSQVLVFYCYRLFCFFRGWNLCNCQVVPLVARRLNTIDLLLYFNPFDYSLVYPTQISDLRSWRVMMCHLFPALLITVIFHTNMIFRVWFDMIIWRYFPYISFSSVKGDHCIAVDCHNYLFYVVFFLLLGRIIQIVSPIILH